MKKVGKDGIITVEESKTLETQLEVVEGMQLIVGIRWTPIRAPCWGAIRQGGPVFSSPEQICGT
jgi:chaperonin GroEL (HSP60 family)